PPAGFTGADTFSYDVADGRGGTDAATVTVTVHNAAPVAADDSATPVSPGPVTVDVLTNDSDPDGDTLAVTSTTSATSGAVVINPDGTVTYTPVVGFTGSDGFDYTVDDGHGGTATAHVTIAV